MVFIYAFSGAFALACFLPFWLVFINSFATESAIKVHGYQLIPKEFSLNAYQYVLHGKQIASSYLVSTTVTVAGTVLAVLITAMYAYVLAHPKAKYRNVLILPDLFHDDLRGRPGRVLYSHRELACI